MADGKKRPDKLIELIISFELIEFDLYSSVEFRVVTLLSGAAIVLAYNQHLRSGDTQ